MSSSSYKTPLSYVGAFINVMALIGILVSFDFNRVVSTASHAMENFAYCLLAMALGSLAMAFGTTRDFFKGLSLIMATLALFFAIAIFWGANLAEGVRLVH